MTAAPTTELIVDISLDEVMATARAIVKNPTRRALTGVPTKKLAAMATTLACLDDIAVLAARLGTTVVPADFQTLRIELGLALGALGYLTLVPEPVETTDER